MCTDLAKGDTALVALLSALKQDDRELLVAAVFADGYPAEGGDLGNIVSVLQASYPQFPISVFDPCDQNQETMQAVLMLENWVEAQMAKNMQNLSDQVEPPVRRLSATWCVSLNVTCPSCKERVDLLDYADFWDGNNKLQVGHQVTDFEATCPACGAEFKVDLDYD